MPFAWSNDYSASAAECNGVHTDCVSCASSTGGPIGGTCRWCPRDQQCHDKGAIFTNPCSEKENVIDPKMCNKAPPKFDEILMKAHFASSAAAYSDNPSACLSTQLPSYDFQVSHQMTTSCDFFGTNCSGFLAVSKPEKVAVLAFRGTAGYTQLVIEGIKSLLPSAPAPLGGSVGQYWSNALKVLAPLLQETVTALDNDPSLSLWITGHSLGGAIASLAHDTIMAQTRFVGRKISSYTFGQPRVGDYWYAMKHDQVAKDSWRLVNAWDLVPHLPWCDKLKYDGFPIPICLGPVPPALGNGPYHHGTEVWVNGTDKVRIICDADDPRVAPALPRNEAINCSNSLYIIPQPVCLGHCIDDHENYFGVEVHDWGVAGCH